MRDSPSIAGSWIRASLACAAGSPVTLLIRSAVTALIHRQPTLPPRRLTLALNAVLLGDLPGRLQRERYVARTLIRCDSGNRRRPW